MKIRPLSNVGVEICDIDISDLSENQYLEIREIFLENLMVLFRGQSLDTLPFAKLVSSMGGPIANFSQCVWDKSGNEFPPMSFQSPFTWSRNDHEYPVQRVTGMKRKGVETGIFGAGKLDWHSNMNGPFNRAPGVALHGISGVEGTSTSWMDTTAAYSDLSDEVKNRCQNIIGVFEYSPEIWAEGLPEWQLNFMTKNKESSYEMPLVNISAKNKVGLYFHYLNKCRFPTDPALLEILKNHCFQEKYIFTLDWQPGDIHLSDQVLTLHKRNQDDPNLLNERVLHRYTFHFDSPSYKVGGTI